MKRMKITLSEILKRRGLSQKQAAVKTGMSENAISKLCNAQVRINVTTIAKICAGLDISPNQLFGYTDGDE